MANGRRSNAAQFQRDLAKMADEAMALAHEGAIEIALEVRDRAEENSRTRLGHEPGGPDISESWWAGVKPPESDEPTSRESSEADLRAHPNATTLYVGNHAFTSYFHELGYYRRDGGARPKWMLRDALIAVDGTVRHK